LWQKKDPQDTTPPKSKDELESKCEYWPLNLDKETPTFREKLDFFGDTFIFSRAQMSVFINTLNERLAETKDTDEVEEITT
jgi:hypothetical protein